MGDGFLGSSEIEYLVNDKFVCKEFCETFDLSVQQLRNMFYFLSEEKDGNMLVSKDAIMDEMRYVGKYVSERSMLRIHKQVRDLAARVNRLSDSAGQRLEGALQLVRSC